MPHPTKRGSSSYCFHPISRFVNSSQTFGHKNTMSRVFALVNSIQVTDIYAPARTPPPGLARQDTTSTVSLHLLDAQPDVVLPGPADVPRDTSQHVLLFLMAYISIWSDPANRASIFSILAERSAIWLRFLRCYSHEPFMLGSRPLLYSVRPVKPPLSVHTGPLGCQHSSHRPVTNPGHLSRRQVGGKQHKEVCHSRLVPASSTPPQLCTAMISSFL